MTVTTIQVFPGAQFVFRDLNQQGVVYKVAGVIGGFRFDIEPVFEAKEITREQITAEDLTESRLAMKNGRILPLPTARSLC